MGPKNFRCGDHFFYSKSKDEPTGQKNPILCFIWNTNNGAQRRPKSMITTPGNQCHRDSNPESAKTRDIDAWLSKPNVVLTRRWDSNPASAKKRDSNTYDNEVFGTLINKKHTQKPLSVIVTLFSRCRVQIPAGTCQRVTATPRTNYQTSLSRFLADIGFGFNSMNQFWYRCSLLFHVHLFEGG